MLSLYFLLFSKKSYQFPYFILIYITALEKLFTNICNKELESPQITMLSFSPQEEPIVDFFKFYPSTLHGR